MDFEQCFIDCCTACNPLGSKFRPSSEIQGQGDCKGSINFQEHQISWEKGKNIKNKFREEDRFGFKEQQKKQLNTYCNCLSKNNKDENFSGKIRHETKYEKKNTEIFEFCSTPRNSSYANWSNNRIKESSDLGYLRNNDLLNPDKLTNLSGFKLIAETLSELKEKVEFLFKNFKDYNPKVFNDTYNEKSRGDYIGMKSENASHLLNINKRLGIAEKSIQKLTLILEHLLEDSNKRKASFAKTNLIFSEPMNFEKMPVTQKIHLLKNRNDFLLSFMRDFLQVRSVEELHSMVDLMPRDDESNQNPWNPTVCFVKENQSNDFHQEDVTETLKELKRQVSKDSKETPPHYNEDHPTRPEKRGENATKCSKNKLEVISEQAELAFYYDNEYEEGLNKFRKKNNGHSKEKLAEVKQGFIEEDSGISDKLTKTAKLLAQEAMLKSSLDDADFEIFSSQDSSGKNVSLSKNILTTETPTEGNTETSLDSSSCVSSYWETENAKKYKVNNIGKFHIHEKFKKQGKNVESVSSALPKRNTICSKKSNNISDAKNRFPCKVLQQKSHTFLAPTVKAKQNAYCLSEVCSFSRGETKKEVKAKDQRPLSTPGPHNRTLQTSSIKAPVTEKNRQRNSGINNVKNKNKLLLSQKSCVRTA